MAISRVEVGPRESYVLYLYARIRLATGDHVFSGMISLKIQPRATLRGGGTGKGRVSGERCAVRHSTVPRVGCFFEKN